MICKQEINHFGSKQGNTVLSVKKPEYTVKFIGDFD